MSSSDNETNTTQKPQIDSKDIPSLLIGLYTLATGGKEPDTKAEESIATIFGGLEKIMDQFTAAAGDINTTLNEMTETVVSVVSDMEPTTDEQKDKILNNLVETMFRKADLSPAGPPADLKTVKIAEAVVDVLAKSKSKSIYLNGPPRTESNKPETSNSDRGFHEIIGMIESIAKASMPGSYSDECSQVIAIMTRVFTKDDKYTIDYSKIISYFIRTLNEVTRDKKDVLKVLTLLEKACGIVVGGEFKNALMLFIEFGDPMVYKVVTRYAELFMEDPPVIFL